MLRHPMHSSVLVDRMPGVSASNRSYVPGSYTSSYTSSYSSHSYKPSTPTNKYSTAYNLQSSSSSSYKPSSRRLPTGPGPLDSSGKRLSDFSLRTRTPSNTRAGPLKADYSSSLHDNYSTYKSSLSRRTSNHDTNYGSLGRMGRRSASISSLNDLSLNDNHGIGETRTSSRTYGTTPRRGSILNNEDTYGSRTSSRTSRISMSVDRDGIHSPEYLSHTQSRTSRNASRDPSPARERGTTPSRRYSTERRESPTSNNVSRQSSNSSISNSKYANGGKVGLRNLGNTCFMSSVIQCLSNTKPLLEYCQKEAFFKDINTSTSSMKGALVKAYANLMQSMWKERSEDYISPNSFKTQIQKFAPRFMGYSQQDSQEFLRYLLEGLHEDVNKVQSKPKAIILEDDDLEGKSDQEKSAEYWKAYLNFDNSRIVDIFVGQLKSELKFQCGHRSVTFDPFWDLSLPIPKGKYEVNLDDCIRLFMKEEDLQDHPMCAKCKKRQACTKSFSIQKFPKILVLHLKRFSQERFGRKLSTSVEYPTSSLDLDRYAAEKSHSGRSYNLYAVSNHSGSVHSGHYTAICKNPYSSEWHTFNDTRVSQARSNQAVSSEGYLLFYEQM